MTDTLEIVAHVPSTARSLNSPSEELAGFAERLNAVASEAATLTVTDVSQKEDMQRARTLRLACVKIRTALDSRRKELGEEARKRVDSINRVAKEMRESLESLEASLLQAEEFEKRFLEDQRSKLAAKRLAAAKDASPMILHITADSMVAMSEKEFNDFLAERKQFHAFKLAEEKRLAEESEKARIERERIAEEKRLAEEVERKRLVAENARLQAAAAEAEKLRRAEQIAAETARAAEAAAKARIATVEAAARAEKERQEAAARAAAAAPDLEKLLMFAAEVGKLVVPQLSTQSGRRIQAEVQAKVTSFAKWIKEQSGKI